MGKEISHKHGNKEHHEHNVEHKPEHHVKNESKFSLFKHRIAGMFKDIVEAPPEPVAEETPAEGLRGEDDIHIVQFGGNVAVKEEAKIKKKGEEPEDDEIDEDGLRTQEREKTREMIHEHIASKLNEAVSKWKETGDVGLHLEPPVPLREKVKGILSKIKTKSAPLSVMLKSRMDEVMEKVSARMKKAEHSGEKVNTDDVVKEEWTKVLAKVESVTGPSERDEIEKIYKQLGGEQ